MSLLLLPDCILTLAGLDLVIVLVDKTTSRVLAHLDTIRQLSKTTGLDLVQIFASWEQAKIDSARQHAQLTSSAEQADIEIAAARLRLHEQRVKLLAEESEPNEH